MRVLKDNGADGPLELAPRSVAPRPALTLGQTCAVPIAPWRSGWGVRHTAVALVCAPLTWSVYRSAAGPVTGWGWAALLVLMALGAGIVVASYVPAQDGRRRESLSPCAIAPLAQLLFAAMFLAMGSALSGRAVFAAGVVGLALARRTTGSSTCRIR